MAAHAIQRTSPYGERFVGVCSKCGKRGLTFRDLNEECENVRGVDDAQALLESMGENLGDEQ